MVDVFLDRVSRLAGRTARVLDNIAGEIGDDFVTQADTLQRVATEHKQIVMDCLVETQPITVRRQPLGRQLRDLAEVTRQIAAELMQRRLTGHDVLSDVAEELQRVSEVVDRQLEP